jgi:hypothetical protein
VFTHVTQSFECFKPSKGSHCYRLAAGVPHLTEAEWQASNAFAAPLNLRLLSRFRPTVFLLLDAPCIVGVPHPTDAEWQASDAVCSPLNLRLLSKFIPTAFLLLAAALQVSRT